MSKRIAILQSNYIPWKGYFDLINSVDEFIIFDSAQYTKNDWRNRNKIKTNNGTIWLTIPIKQDSLSQLIKDTKVANKNWSKKHWKSIVQNYSKAKYFKDYKDEFEELYINNSHEYLSDINHDFINKIMKILGITTKIRFSTEFELLDGQTEKLLSICQQAGADTYLSGPSAKSYFDEEQAKRKNIKIEWIDYSEYQEYNQLFPPFDQFVSILDLIFNEGKDSLKYMKSGDK